MTKLTMTLLAAMMIGWCNIATAQETENASVSGEWKGTRSMSGRSGIVAYKIQSIKFDLVEDGNTITGAYRCYAGEKANTDCPSPVGKITKGTIQGNGVKWTVRSQPNQIRCTYQGSMKEAKMSGTYTCYSGGSLSSNGVWNVHRE